jgi:hypothetical protein
MLAAASPLGDNYLLIVGPLVVVVAICVWIGLTVTAARRKGRPGRGHIDHPDRGAVQGGVMEGDPGQRNRRDEAPRQD